MKKYIKISMIAVLSLGLSSCNDFLDMTPTDSSSDKMVFGNAKYTELSINRFYHYIEYAGQYESTGQSSAGLTEGMTEILKCGSTSLMPNMWFPNQIAYAEDGLPAHTAAYFLGNWSSLYSYISEVNIVLSNMNKYSKFDQSQVKRLRGEARFFRGFLYFELLKRHKQCIIRDENLEEKYKYNVPLNTEAECWQFVYEDLKYAAENLPAVSSLGRITSGAANGILSRAMLYAERWKDARDAAKAVIESGKYSLTKDYKTAWSKTASQGNTESIIEYEYNLGGITHSFDNDFTPGGDSGVLIGALGTPTQEMVEMYEKADGSGVPDWKPWHNTSGTKETPPYDKLEPRFAATIIYNGCTWKGRIINSTVSGDKDGYIAWKEKPNTGGKTTTGYFLRKLVDEKHDLLANSNCTQPWIALRYAEILLNYAEACYNLKDDSQAQWANNEIRTRVGLPSKNLNGEDLLNAIRKERKIELAYEGQLYWDMRRWKMSSKSYSGIRVHGLRIEKIAGELIYTYVDCDGQDRYFPERMYQIPIPQSELNNNTAIKQFEAWR